MIDPKVVKEIFTLLDFDGSGSVKTSDLRMAFKGTGLSKEDIDKFIQTYDKDNKGVINFAELTALLNTVHGKTSRAKPLK